MPKLNFKLSLTSYTNLTAYGAYFNLPPETIIRCLIFEQLHLYKYNNEFFNQNYKRCKPREIEGTTDAYGKKKKPKTFSLKTSAYIRDGVYSIQEKYNDTLNTVVNNLLHMGLGYRDLSNFTPQYSITYEYGEPIKSDLIDTPDWEGTPDPEDTHKKESTPRIRPETLPTKQYAIPLSRELLYRLDNLSLTTGIKKNQLISIIVGNYFLDHSDEYEWDMEAGLFIL